MDNHNIPHLVQLHPKPFLGKGRGGMILESLAFESGTWHSLPFNHIFSIGHCTIKASQKVGRSKVGTCGHQARFQGPRDWNLSETPRSLHSANAHADGRNS